MMNDRTMQRLIPNAKWLSLGVFLLLSGSAMAGEVNFSGLVADQSVIFWLLAIGLALQVILIAIVGGAIRNIAESRTLWFDKKEDSEADDSTKSGTGSAPIVAILALIAFSFSGFSAFAQEANSPEFTGMSERTFWWMVAANAFLFCVLMALLRVLRSLLRTAVGEPEVQESGFSLESLTERLTATVPIEMEHEIKLDHNYDGIEELDNRLPPWWVWGFVLCIVFAFVYIGHYHIFKTGELSIAEYNTTMTEAAEQVAAYRALMANSVDENNVVALVSESSLENGSNTFKTHCVACHGQGGEGTLGPNLTDQYWKHGGGIKNVFSTIKFGVKEKGMIAWQTQLSPVQIQEVASYVLTLEGTEPPNQKDPEGDLWVPENSSAPTPAANGAAASDSLVVDSLPSNQLGMASQPHN